MPLNDEHKFTPSILLEALLPRPKSAFKLLIQRDSEVMNSGHNSDAAHDSRVFDAEAYAAACKENVVVCFLFF